MNCQRKCFILLLLAYEFTNFQCVIGDFGQFVVKESIESSQNVSRTKKDLQSLLNWAIVNSNLTELSEKAKHKTNVSSLGGDSSFIEDLKLNFNETTNSTKALPSSTSSEGEQGNEVTESVTNPLASDLLDEDPEILIELLQDLEEYVEQIDNANGLNHTGGLAMLSVLLRHESPKVGAAVAAVLRAAAANNAIFQEHVSTSAPEIFRMLLNLSLSGSFHSLFPYASSENFSYPPPSSHQQQIQLRRAAGKAMTALAALTGVSSAGGDDVFAEADGVQILLRILTLPRLRRSNIAVQETSLILSPSSSINEHEIQSSSSKVFDVLDLGKLELKALIFLLDLGFRRSDLVNLKSVNLIKSILYDITPFLLTVLRKSPTDQELLLSGVSGLLDSITESNYKSGSLVDSERIPGLFQALEVMVAELKNTPNDQRPVCTSIDDGHLESSLDFAGKDDRLYESYLENLAISLQQRVLNLS
uniref:Nucleotide exchange factor SIL1 n=1 Tax=Polytomella parva TaxID=51329 RepID=A0A7S0YIU9_9CHLO